MIEARTQVIDIQFFWCYMTHFRWFIHIISTGSWTQRCRNGRASPDREWNGVGTYFGGDRERLRFHPFSFGLFPGTPF